MKQYISSLIARVRAISSNRLAPVGIVVGTGLTLAAGVFVTGCVDHTVLQAGQGIRSNSPKPDWGPTITPQQLAVIEELGRLAPTPPNGLTPQEARRQPSFKDAVNSLLAKNGVPPLVPNVSTSQITVTGAGGAPIRAVVYTPRNVTGTLPVIVYYHGGGWVIASPEVYENSAVALAQNVGAIVVSVDYRLAPENKFPTAHNDAFAAYRWVLANASSIGGNPAKVAVAGESAGGNMAITVAMNARDNNVALPKHILAVFPVANNDLTTESYRKYSDAMSLSKAGIIYFTNNYFNSMADGDSPLISLVDVAILKGLPPTTIIAAEIDPLQTEGMTLRDRLRQEGVSTSYMLYPGTTHEFFGMYAIVPEAAQAQTYAAAQLKAAFQ